MNSKKGPLVLPVCRLVFLSLFSSLVLDHYSYVRADLQSEKSKSEVGGASGRGDPHAFRFLVVIHPSLTLSTQGDRIPTPCLNVASC